MLTTHFSPAPRRTPRSLPLHLLELSVRGWAIWRHKRAQRKTVQILQGLDCRTLKDIGVSPSEIESVVYGNPCDRTQYYRSDWRLWTAS